MSGNMLGWGMVAGSHKEDELDERSDTELHNAAQATAADGGLSFAQLIFLSRPSQNRAFSSRLSTLLVDPLGNSGMNTTFRGFL